MLKISTRKNKSQSKSKNKNKNKQKNFQNQNKPNAKTSPNRLSNLHQVRHFTLAFVMSLIKLAITKDIQER